MLLLPAPPLTGDSPGTTSVRQRLSHQVPSNRSLARTTHFSPIQLPDVSVIVPCVTAGNLRCASDTSKSEHLHPALLCKQLGQCFMCISYFLLVYTTPCCWPLAEYSKRPSHQHGILQPAQLQNLLLLCCSAGT